MNNRPVLKLGIVAVSRNCFPMSLSVSRREAVVKAYRETYGEIMNVQLVLKMKYICRRLYLRYEKQDVMR